MVDIRSVLRDSEIRLRPVEPDDLDILYQWENDPEIWQVSNTLYPFSRDIIRSYLLNAHKDIRETGQFRFMITLSESNDELSHNASELVIGSIDLFDYDPHHQRAGVGILIKSPKHRKKGYAARSLRLLCRYAFDILLLHQLYCNISAQNRDSLKLFRNAGFEIVGTKKDWNRIAGGWMDEVLLQKLNSGS